MLFSRLQREESGFSLLELLVVILVVGILAAIALPAFLAHGGKAHDAAAKSDARNMTSQMEVCYAHNESYARCPTQNGATGLPGTVTVKARKEHYEITAKSASRNVFYVEKKRGGKATARTCTKAGNAGCPSSGAW